MVADYIVSVDAGNGGTNGLLIKSSGGKTQSVYFPSVRTRVSGDTLDSDAGAIMNVAWHVWGNRRYVVGDDVLGVSVRRPERHMGDNRYGNEFHRHLVALALARMGVKEGTVDLTVFAPPGIYADAKKAIREAFLDDNGATGILLKGEKKPRGWAYASVRVLPEGAAAALNFVYDDKGQPIENGVLDGQVLWVDSGTRTLNTVLTMDGELNPEALESGTIDEAGLDEQMRRPLLNAVRKHDRDFSTATEDHIDLLFRRGLMDDQWELTIAGKTLDMKQAVWSAAETYANFVFNTLDTRFRALKGIRHVVLLGGGAAFLQPYMERWYPDKHLDLSKMKCIAGVKPYSMNVTGGFRAARAKAGV